MKIAASPTISATARCSAPLPRRHTNQTVTSASSATTHSQFTISPLARFWRSVIPRSIPNIARTATTNGPSSAREEEIHVCQASPP